MADVSSAQETNGVDLKAYAASGRHAIAIKVTEGLGYHFRTGDVWESEALSDGLTVVRYHYAGNSIGGVLYSPEQEAAFCLSQLGAHVPGRLIAIDFENPLPGHGPPLYGLTPTEAAQWCESFLSFMAVHGDYLPGMGYSMMGSGVIQQLTRGFLKWYAAYPGPVPRDADLHQFTSRGSVPGVGFCDDSYVYVDLPALAHPTPLPPPPPKPLSVALYG